MIDLSCSKGHGNKVWHYPKYALWHGNRNFTFFIFEVLFIIHFDWKFLFPSCTDEHVCIVFFCFIFVAAYKNCYIIVCIIMSGIHSCNIFFSSFISYQKACWAYLIYWLMSVGVFRTVPVFIFKPFAVHIIWSCILIIDEASVFQLIIIDHVLKKTFCGRVEFMETFIRRL